MVSGPTTANDQHGKAYGGDGVGPVAVDCGCGGGVHEIQGPHTAIEGESQRLDEKNDSGRKDRADDSD